MTTRTQDLKKAAVTIRDRTDGQILLVTTDPGSYQIVRNQEVLHSFKCCVTGDPFKVRDAFEKGMEIGFELKSKGVL